MREYLSRLLTGTYRVTLATDGVEALEQAIADPPDLVLTDVMMPRLDGFGLLTALRDHPTTGHVPIVMLSARAGEDSTVEGLEAGADDYLIKPFTARELLGSGTSQPRARSGTPAASAGGAQPGPARPHSAARRRRQLGARTRNAAGPGVGRVRPPVAARHAGTSTCPSSAKCSTTGYHPEDSGRVQAAAGAASMETGAPLNVEARLLLPDGQTRIFHVVAEVQRDEDGQPVRLAGSNQDVTEQRAGGSRAGDGGGRAGGGAARAPDRGRTAAQPVAAPRRTPPTTCRSPRSTARASKALTSAATGTTSSSSAPAEPPWCSATSWGAGCRAAAVMGQLRAAVRAYARLDLPPADVLEFMDGVVRELGEDQIVTCVYAVYDPGRRDAVVRERRAPAATGWRPPTARSWLEGGGRTAARAPDCWR